MNTVTILNESNLVEFLSANEIKHEVRRDGWDVTIFYQDAQQLFSIGKSFGKYKQHLKNNPPVS